MARKELCVTGSDTLPLGDMLASRVFDVAVNWRCCFLFVDYYIACPHIDITMPCVLLLLVDACCVSILTVLPPIMAVEGFHRKIRHKQVPRVSIPPHGTEGSSFETSLAWCSHLPCPANVDFPTAEASGIPITNWMMFIQEQLMLGRGIPVPTDIRWVTFGPLEAAGSSSIATRRCSRKHWDLYFF